MPTVSPIPIWHGGDWSMNSPSSPLTSLNVSAELEWFVNVTSMMPPPPVTVGGPTSHPAGCASAVLADADRTSAARSVAITSPENRIRGHATPYTMDPPIDLELRAFAPAW